MHQGLSSGRLGRALVFVAFCLPLFVGLGRADLETDEAAHSFAVDRFLEIGDWLAPRSSPSETTVFLEKPPLKFWIVAAPIRAGILPDNEFGLRFWDAVFGGAAFLYVFGIGRMMAGPVCGLIAVLMLFVHAPLLFDHGLRTNNMESALVLSYCGGVWHFLRWSAAERARIGRLHATLTGLYFVLGFMTKFVAVLFLPLVLGGAALIVGPTRRKLAESWRLWTAVFALVVGLIAPWFLYAQHRFGRAVWDTMVSMNLYERFTASLDPTHLQPWSFYLVTVYKRFAESQSAWLVIVGMIALLVLALRRRSIDLVVVLLWGTVPIALISFGTSKLYHYVFPFLPPLALGAAYALALAVILARALVLRLVEWVDDFLIRSVPSLSTARSTPWVRKTATVIFWFAAALAVAGASDLPVRIIVTDWLFFKSGGVFRPFVVMVLAAALLGPGPRVLQIIVAVTTLSLVPIAGYFVTFSRLGKEAHPIRSVRDCIRDVQSRIGGLPPGIYADTNRAIWHPTYYYLRKIQPWTRQETPLPAALDRHLHEPEAWQPSLVAEERYRSYVGGPEGYRFRGISPPSMTIIGHILFLPGPYTTCSPETVLHGPR